jgi:hypothetical protein
MPHLPELERRGYRFFFLYTITGNARPFEGHAPAASEAVPAFLELADRVGADRVIWRYDPIVLTAQTDTGRHAAAFRQIATALAGATHRCIISPLTVYRKNAPRLGSLTEQGLGVYDDWRTAAPELIPTLAAISRANGMEIQSCASAADFSPWGVPAGKCIDDAWIRRVFGTEVSPRKDPSQRATCGCVVSKDIGAYDTCLFGCAYCYATRSTELARANFSRHRPDGPLLLPRGDLRNQGSAFAGPAAGKSRCQGSALPPARGGPDGSEHEERSL